MARILLGVTGSIAAYKAAELARLLVKDGAEVRVVMTRSASEFIGPMTLQAIRAHPVREALFDPEHEAAMGHIELARWADLVLIAPATAEIMARLAGGGAPAAVLQLGPSPEDRPFRARVEALAIAHGSRPA